MQIPVATIPISEKSKLSFEEMISRDKELKERIEYYMRELITISGGKLEKVEKLLGAAMLSVETITVLLKYSAQQYGADRFQEIYQNKLTEMQTA